MLESNGLVAVQQKLTGHYKSTIIFKKSVKNELELIQTNEMVSFNEMTEKL